MSDQSNPEQPPQAARRPNRERYDFEANWPSNVWSIGVDRVDLIGVDEQGELYWNGRRVEVRRGVSLTFWQKVGAIIVAIATICAATGTCITAYTDWAGMTRAAKEQANTCTHFSRGK